MTEAALLGFYIFILASASGGLALSVRALIREEYGNAIGGGMLVAAIIGAVLVPVML